MARPGVSRHRMARTLNAAYGDGLLSENTFVSRIDLLFGSALIEPAELTGDLTLRAPPRTRPEWISRVAGFAHRLRRDPDRVRATLPPLLALDWSGAQEELVVGRHLGCDIVLEDSTVSRRHARLRFRDGGWIVQDLGSTNGTSVNDAPVGRCRLCPGDRLTLGDQELRVD